jgi:truncated hemoglobin YjbI
MNRRTFARVAGLVTIAAVLGGCSSSSLMKAAPSLYEQLGGTNAVSKMGSDLLASSMKDPRLSGLLGKVDPSTANAKVSDQLCAALGGGCKPAFTDEQVTAAADRLDPDQKKALSENFGSALSSATSNPALREAVTKSLGSKMGGIMGALL